MHLIGDADGQARKIYGATQAVIQNEHEHVEGEHKNAVHPDKTFRKIWDLAQVLLMFYVGVRERRPPPCAPGRARGVGGSHTLGAGARANRSWSHTG